MKLADVARQHIPFWIGEENTQSYHRNDVLESQIKALAPYPSRYSLIELCVNYIKPIQGSVMEFGVRTGESLEHFIRLCPERSIFGFDSFQGLPEEWKVSSDVTVPAGWYSTRPHVTRRQGVHLVEGWFDTTLDETIRKWNWFTSGCAHISPALVHIDCDLYSSTLTVLTKLKPYLRPGSVLLFDELMDFEGIDYLNWRVHEWKALLESGINVRPLARTSYQQVALVVD